MRLQTVDDQEDDEADGESADYPMYTQAEDRERDTLDREYD